MEIKKISSDAMKKFIGANGKECDLSVQKTTVYAIGSSGTLVMREAVPGGLPVQVEGGFRKAERRKSGIEETCWWIIKDPPGEKGYFAIGPISKKKLSITDISKGLSSGS